MRGYQELHEDIAGASRNEGEKAAPAENTSGSYLGG